MAGKPRESRVRTLTYVAGSHTFPITGPIRPTANQLCSIFDIENALNTIPASIVERSQVAKISVLDTPNNADKDWEKKTKINNFWSFATANSKSFEIEMYKNRESSWMVEDNHMQILAKKICHELAHLFDTSVGKVFGFTYLGVSKSAVWRNAVAADNLNTNHGFISEYAESHNNASADNAYCEDFADSLANFFCFPKWNAWMLKNTPNRVAVIRLYFPAETEAAIRRFATA